MDRFYIERFMRWQSDDVHGRVMEVQAPRYAEPVGGARITSLTIVDIDASNPLVTVVGDLCAPETLAGHTFDCAIVTQTLQFLPDVRTALENLWHALTPKGVLLLTVPVVSRPLPEFPDLWRFTPQGLEQLLRSTLPSAQIEVMGAGNLTACISFLVSLSVENVGEDHLRHDDEAFPLLCCARVVRPA